MVELRPTGTLAAHGDHTAFVDDGDGVEPGEHDIRHRRRFARPAACDHPLGGVAELERAPPDPEPAPEVVQHAKGVGAGGHDHLGGVDADDRGASVP